MNIFPDGLVVPDMFTWPVLLGEGMAFTEYPWSGCWLGFVLGRGRVYAPGEMFFLLAMRVTWDWREIKATRKLHDEKRITTLEDTLPTYIGVSKD